MSGYIGVGVKCTRLAVAGLNVILTAWTSAAWATFDSASTPSDRELQIQRVLPEGEDVPGAERKILVTFDRPVVAVGAMDSGAAAPVTVTPAVSCHWHWLDPRSLACEMDAAQALSPATRYTVTVAGGVTAQDGAKLEQAYRWTFTTERPAVTGYAFREWRAPGMPVVRLSFNQPVTKDTVETRVGFGSDKASRAEPDPSVPDVFYAKSRPAASGEHGERGVEARRVWLVSPPRELPADMTIPLRVRPGLHAYSGPLPGTEHRTVVAVDTFPEFRFLGIRCQVGRESVLIPAPGGTPKSTAAGSARPAGPPRPACNPAAPPSLVFSAPVSADEVKAHLVLEPDLLHGRTDYDPWAGRGHRSRVNMPHAHGAEYAVNLPETLRAFQLYSISRLDGIRDEFGRPLREPAAMAFRTDHRSPRLKVPHSVAVLEKNAPTAMPLIVTNVTDIDIRYRKLTGAGSQARKSDAAAAATELTFNQAIDRAWDIAYATPAKVRQLLDGKSGVLSGRLLPHPLPPGEESTAYDGDGDEDPGMASGHGFHDFFAQVTPFEVHAKLGAYNTLVWVTTLDKGRPVKNAHVRIYRDNVRGLTIGKPALAEALTDRDGVAVLAGRLALERDAPPTLTPDHSYVVRVEKNDDLALLPLDGSFLLDTYRASRGRFWSETRTDQEHLRAWGTTAQGVYKLGDTIQYKIYLRKQDNLSLSPVPQTAGYSLDVIDPTGKTVFTAAQVVLSAFGAYAGSFRVPAAGAVGWYDFRLHGAADPSTGQAAAWTPMRVLVADFTPAPFHVSNTLSGQRYEPGDAVDVTTLATLHAGGPYANAGSRITARLIPQTLEIADPKAAGFSFASAEPAGTCDGQNAPETSIVHQAETNTGDRGEFATHFTLPDAGMLSARLEVESAVRDERGKYVANRSYAEYRGRGRYVGLRSERWTYEEGMPATLQYLVVDASGSVVTGTPVAISIQAQVVNAARVKGAGDAYLTSYQPQWVDAGACKGSSGKEPQACTFTPKRPGLHSIKATVVDAHGRAEVTESCVWVTGKGQVLWEEPADLSLSLIPEKPSYRIGEHARYLVKNPFPGAEALITIERYGVIRHWVQVLAGNTPIIDFTVEPDFMPGFYLSVVVMSPRVAPVPGASPLGKDGVDLGRPTYRMGYVQVPVSDPSKTLAVHVESERATYKPRETVKLSLSAAPYAAATKKEPVEFAVVVLDEAVFDLVQDGRQYFDPYRGLYHFDNLDLENYSLLSRLVGLQKFAKKGANSGGDGGAGFDMRSISQYVAYWNPSVVADRGGRAAVSFELPDNLTGWRVFAIAVTPGDRLGVGEHQFRSSKLTELRPVLPDQLTSGDRFTAGFSVLNRSDRTRTIEVTVRAQGPIDGGGAKTRQSLTLAPFKRETVWLPLVTSGTGRLQLSASAGDTLDRDALTHDLPVNARVPLDVAASYGTTLAPQIDEPLAFPAGMLPDAGRLTVELTPSVLGNLDGAFRYVRDYPYLCWEQRLTKALMAANFIALRPYLAADLDWPQAATLPQTLLDDAASFQAPNGGMGFWIGADDYASPYLSAATALAFNRLRGAGYRVPEAVDSRLEVYLKALLRSNTAPTFYSEGMVSSVRAVALQALAERGRVTLDDLQRYAPHAPRMDLFGLAAYLDAALKFRGAEDLARASPVESWRTPIKAAGNFSSPKPGTTATAQLWAPPCAAIARY